LRIEREDRRFVARGVEPTEEVIASLPGVRQPRLHAAARVEQQRDGDATRITSKIDDWSALAAIEYREVSNGKVLDESALLVAYDGSHAHEIDRGLERGDRRGRLARCHTLKGQHRCDRRYETARRHRPR
jgi:hypothetical protein